MLEYCIDIRSNSISHGGEITEFQKSLPFCVFSCGEFYAKEKYFTKRNNLPNYLLIVTIEGCGEMRSKNDYCLLEKGSAVIVDCNLYHEYNTYPGDIWNFYWTHFKPLSLTGYEDFLLKKLTPVTLRNPKTVEGFMRNLQTLSFAQNPLNYLQQSNLLSNILTEMVCSVTEEYALKTPRKDVEQLTAYIRDNFKKELHLDDFMQTIHLSKHHLIRLFEKETGITPYRFLHLCRIKHAQFLLKSTALTVKQIAHESGYRDATVFIRRFKSFTSLTPLAYRNKLTPLP